MFSSTKTATSTGNFSERLADLQRLIAEADYVLIGAGAGLTTAAGIDYAGEDFRREFRAWIDRYGITDLYSAGFYPFKTDEERWAMWAKHIWFSRYRTGALPLYKELLKRVDGKDYFVITTNVDGQFEMAGFDPERIFATQGDYCYFQPASGAPKELYHNREWVERALPAIHNCRIPTELIPHTSDGQPVSMNLRCDDTFVEDEHWHRQAQRYSDSTPEAMSTPSAWTARHRRLSTSTRPWWTASPTCTPTSTPPLPAAWWRRSSPCRRSSSSVK